MLVLVSACTPPFETSVPTTLLSSATPEATPTVGPTATVVPTPDSVQEKTEPTPIPPTSTPTPTPKPTPTPTPQAKYRLVFEATWSGTTHPADFPSIPHFSGLIGATHNPSVLLWEGGAPASPGIKNMAETGSKNPLRSEVNTLIDAGSACELISGDGIRLSPGSVELTFTAAVDCPAVSIVTMIAPSPDWFAGVSALHLQPEGSWVNEIVVDLLPYDAGTDSGESYTSANAATNPPESISLLATSPLQVDGHVQSLGTFTFTRIGE